MRISLKYSFFLVALSVFASCKKVLDINEDPNNPTQVATRLLLPAAQVQLGYTIGGSVNRVTGAFTQHYAGHRGDGGRAGRRPPADRHRLGRRRSGRAGLRVPRGRRR